MRAYPLRFRPELADAFAVPLQPAANTTVVPTSSNIPNMVPTTSTTSEAPGRPVSPVGPPVQQLSNDTLALIVSEVSKAVVNGTVDQLISRDKCKFLGISRG